jgi:hypothetical protein
MGRERWRKFNKYKLGRWGRERSVEIDWLLDRKIEERDKEELEDDWEIENGDGRIERREN